MANAATARYGPAMLEVLRYAVLATVILTCSTATAAFVLEPDEICAQ